MDYGLAVGTKLLAGPVSGHLYKLRVFSEIMMRPILCRGPLRMDAEYTVLAGAVERDGELVPSSWEKEAEARRNRIAGAPQMPLQWRCRHEPIR